MPSEATSYFEKISMRYTMHYPNGLPYAYANKYLERKRKKKSDEFGSRPSLMQSDLSVENGLFRLKPKSGFLTRPKKGCFDSTVFDRVFRLGDPVEKLDFFDWIYRSKNSVEKLYTCFSNLLHRSSNRKTHTHMPTHPYQVPHSSIIQQRRRWLGYYCCCFSPQVSAAHS